MTFTAQQWLSKATLVGADLSGGSNGGLLSPDQVKQFLRVAIEASVLVSDCRQETSNATKFEVPRISFGSRILKGGTLAVEAARLASGDQVKPTTGLVTLSTNLFKGEVPVSDEVFEDNIEKEGFADTLMAMIAEAVGRDVEEISIKGDVLRTGGEDQTLRAMDGFIKQLVTNTTAAQKIDATGETKYASIFKRALLALPARYKRNYSALRFYVPIVTQEGWQAELEQRGTTALGDSAVADDMRTSLAYHGIKIVGVPLLSGTDTVNTVSTDYSTFGWLIDPTNMIFGWHRRVRMEKWRDPREGYTSFIPSVRFDAKVANPEAVCLLSNIPAL